MLVFKAWRKSPALTQETTPSQRRITRILSDAQQAAVREFEGSLTTVADLLSRGQTDRVVAMLPTEPWLAAQEALAEELLGELLDAGSRVTLPSIEKASLAYSFDRERPESSQWARQAAGTMISQITGEQRQVVRDIVSAAALGEMDWGDVARRVQGSIGLTTQQAGWVSSHYDRAYITALQAGLSSSQARARARDSANRYQTSVHRYRANTIARTETMRAASEGRVQAWNQGLTEGFINEKWQKEWIAESDGCDICIGLNRKKINVKDSFSVGEPPAHPNCRCDVMLVPPKATPAGGGSGWAGTAFTTLTTLDDLATLGQIGRYGVGQVGEWRQAYEIAVGSGDRRSFGEWFRDVIEPDITVYADEGPRLTFEEIEAKAQEIFDRGMAIAEEAGRDPLWEETNGSLGDALLNALYEYTGYDALPMVLQENEFDDLASGNQVLFRGFSRYRWPGGTLTPDQMMDMLRFGRYFPGQGVYGNGTYASTQTRVAIGYTNPGSDEERGAGLIRMLLLPTAKVIDYSDLTREYREWFAGQGNVRGSTLSWLIGDLGRFAVAKGYDAIYAQSDDIWVVLNRGAIAVSAKPGLGPRTITKQELDNRRMNDDSIPERERFRIDYDDKGYADSLGYDYILTRSYELIPTNPYDPGF